jgi:hypothetical protein
MKTSIKLAVLLSLLAAPAAGQTVLSAPRSGSMTYYDWSFSWNVGSSSEGLELWNVNYKGVKVLHKASMPVVRVKYRGNGNSVSSGCGPYADQLSWNNMIIPQGATSRVTIRHFTGMMEIAVYSKIGGYHLYHAWYLHQDGRLQPMLYSRGWACSAIIRNWRDHRHHPYWRLDFDIESPSQNVVREYRRPNGGSTYNSTLYNNEQNTFRNSGEDIFWTIGRVASSRHVVVSYGWNELRDGGGGPWYSFSNKDEGTRLYRGNEDIGWPFGSLGHLGFGPSESITQSDVVFWAVGHLSHMWSSSDANNPQWHSTGPVIRAVW